MTRHNLLFVDDEKQLLQSLKLVFWESHEVFTATNAAQALQILEQHDIALIIADQRMPEMTGVELIKQVLDLYPRTMRLILTGYTDTAALVDAINQGHIYQYITKPWEIPDLQLVVRRALETYELEAENRSLLSKLQIANERLREENTFLRTEINKDLQQAEIIGCSPAMQQVFNTISRVTRHASTVLLTGETGVGKTLLARYIHTQSPRKDQLFMEQNCGTMPETLMESELFGHKKGAFTGAHQDRKGLFEVTDGGTLFLDEISEMSPALQVKLLQVLQSGQFRRVGDTETREVDVRVIAATNKDLQLEIEAGRFREDLYYRLNVFPVHLPALRERIEDIPLLAEHCLKKHQRKMRIPVSGFSKKALQALCNYNYPGNVRELDNLIARALILSTGDQIEPGEWLPLSTAEILDQTHIKHMEQMETRRLLDLHEGNLKLVAEALGISRTTLWRRLRRYRWQI